MKKILRIGNDLTPKKILEKTLNELEYRLDYTHFPIFNPQEICNDHYTAILLDAGTYIYYILILFRTNREESLSIKLLKLAILQANTIRTKKGVIDTRFNDCVFTPFKPREIIFLLKSIIPKRKCLSHTRKDSIRWIGSPA